MLDDPHAQPDADPPPDKAESTSPAEARFRTCRWHTAPDDGVAYCTHRDVHPFAGTTGFSADAWCPDCPFFKLRRTPKKHGPAPVEY